MDKKEIDKFLAVQASFLAHIKWANSYKLRQKVALINESRENIQAIYNFRK